MADHANGHADLEQRKRELALTDDDLPAGYAEGVARAREFAASWQQRYNLQRQQQQQAQLLQEAAALARHVLVCSRVYVGSLGLDVSKDDLARVFESFGYVKTVDMSFDSATGKHKGFCFIEYECPEPATAAITQLQGAQLGGRSLKLGRPNNVPTDLPNMGLPAPVPERVYIGNVHQDISERDISSVFEAFGKVAECALIPDPITRKHKSYGYIQYESVSSAEAAVVGMNSFELGGRRLVVTRTIMGGPMPLGMSSMPPMPAVVPAAVTGSRLQLVVPPTSSLAITAQPPSAVVNPIMEQVNAKAASINAGVAAHAPPPLPILRTAAAQALPPPLPGLAPVPLPAMPAEARADDGSLTGEETVAISGRQRFEVMQRLAARSEPRTIMLRDMVQPDEVDDDLEGEIKNECTKFGTVTRVFIYGGEGAVRIFVQFAKPEEAGRANRVFDGRYFGGQRIRSQLYDDTRFAAGDFLG
eukprot:Unigene7127_Nuclearia_a/m.21860 Unigene7127_Nuclearia_a/g.21860  ORF Unigene7127_Nuclearia_a/g.21860 Unigene7127_Nuclearia_a/m.21860 type:complete len:474 (-) Unigene7127_Nuclearia_a:344-1765(-)